MSARLIAGGLLAALLPGLAVAFQEEETKPKADWPKVPGDVFFPDPFAVLADDTPVPGAAPVAPVMAESDSDGSTGGASVEPEPVAGAGAPEAAPVDWATLLPPDDLNAEVKAVIDLLSKNSRDVQTYNNSYLAIPPAAAELASLFALGARYDSGVPWQSNAAALAAKARQMVESDLRRGAGGQKQVADPLRTIDALMNGGGGGSGETIEFSDAADFDLLMKRFAAGVETLKTLASSQQVLEANRAEVQREARVLAALSEISADESHQWVFYDDEFITYSKKMTAAATATAEAAGQDFDAYDAARRRLSQTCSNCHGVYRE